MKCDRTCPFYIEDKNPEYDLRFGGPGHVQVPACKLDAPIIVRFESFSDFSHFYDLPIVTEECLCESKRINKIRELLGMEN